MTKKNAALTLGGLSLSLLASAFVAQPNLAWFLHQDMAQFVQIGQQVGNALAQAFNSQWFQLIGIVLFVA